MKHNDGLDAYFGRDSRVVEATVSLEDIGVAASTIRSPVSRLSLLNDVGLVWSNSCFIVGEAR